MIPWALRQMVKGERGYALALALTVMGFGGLVVGGLLSYVNTGLTTTRLSQERLGAYYAADAGVETVIADLRKGHNLYGGDYTWDNGSINGYVPEISIKCGGMFEIKSESDALGRFDVETGVFTDGTAPSDAKDIKCEVNEVMVSGPIHVNVTYKNQDGSTGRTGHAEIPKDAEEGQAFKVFLEPGDSGVLDVQNIGVQEKFYQVTSNAGNTTITSLLHQKPYPADEGSSPYQVTILSWETM